MDFSELVRRAKAAKTGSGTLELDGKQYEYDILPASFEPSIPGFAGTVQGYVFISEEVPEHFRTAVISHEIRCRAKVGVPSHCVTAFGEELKFVTRDRREYLEMRLRSFEALLLARASSAKSYLDELTRTRDRIKQLLSEE